MYYALNVWLGRCRCRLAGVALAAPAVNYWWPLLPANVSRTAYAKLDVRDRRTFWIAHHAPSLLHAWLAQKWFRVSPIVRGERDAFTGMDWEILTELWRKQRETGQVDPVRENSTTNPDKFGVCNFLEY